MKKRFRALVDEMSPYFVYGDLIYDNGVPKIKYCTDMTFKTCLKGTEGQFIGLQDKNGKDIYEGDIFSNDEGELIYIEYNKYSACYCFNYCNDKYENGMVGKYTIENMEVIGNIHLNTELLKNND